MKLICIPLLAICVCAIRVQAENVVLNIKAENTAKEQRAVEVKQYLPAGTVPADILDPADFEIRYDVLNSCYYVHKVFDLEPGTAIDKKIVLRDAWTVPADEIQLLRKHTSDLEVKLRNIIPAESIAMLKNEVLAGLDRVENLQASNTIAVAGATAHVAGYSGIVEIYESTRQSLAKMEDRLVAARIDPGSLLGSIGNIAPSIIEDSNSRPLQWRITVKNTSKNAPRVMVLQQDLPYELKAEDVIDAGVFSTQAAEGGTCRLYLKEVRLAPNEQKEFVVRIRDRWSIQRKRLNSLLAQAIEYKAMLAPHRMQLPSICKEQDSILSEAKALAAEEEPHDFGELYVAYYRDLNRRISLLERRMERLKRLPLASVENGPRVMWIITGILVFLALSGGAVLLRNLLAQQRER